MLRRLIKLLLPTVFVFGSGLLCRAGDLDTIGATLLWELDSTLKGQSVPVAQSEAASTTDFEVNPAAVGQPASLFTWISALGSATTFPNSVGTESGHGDLVGANFYGVTTGPAPKVSHVDNYDADYFVSSIIANGLQPSISARVVNQSWVAGTDANLDNQFDDYAAKHGTLFSSGVGNGGNVLSPGTCYNGLGVGVYGTFSAVGPTPDGRCKPDLVAPDAAQAPYSANSYSIPYVSGAAAVLLQAAARGDGGSNTNAAADVRTIKALLLNGALKPSDWTNSIIRPLDLRYGAGVLNLFNSWNQMKGGMHSFIENSSNSAGGAHGPGSNPANEPVLAGWDFNTINNRSTQFEEVNHYYFQFTNPVTLTATLVWNRQQNQTSVNDLNLFLYNAGSGNLVQSSVSAVDNVEHLFITHLPAGRYDLQVQKSGATQVSASETYALAFEFFDMPLSIVRSGSTVSLSWPSAPTGFRLYSSTSLSPANWSPVNTAPTVSNGRNVVTLSISPGDQFFRLERPEVPGV